MKESNKFNVIVREKFFKLAIFLLFLLWNDKEVNLVGPKS